MADVSDPAIQAAYEDVRSDAKPTNWLLLDYGEKGDKLSVTATGEGGLDELKSKLDDSRASYGYARIEYAVDVESKRVRMVYIIWIGKDVKVMRRGKTSVQSADVKKVLHSFSLEIPASTREELDEKAVVERLKKYTGANYGAGR
ncbi:uncharacterized protein L969DRAFT_60497 [Mixia osmundae IAM 14324]|uniref:ADF-H domain-containing protein n=1 Tax=Mixia osmundae (strain CBS 9802 / IAM 14324 / JCM 22182 / KY 12970) TaxID=764103 RepID=G7E9A2_MIXOS|nr:uncharacterized protein L969DRAFT_60497 [Mixia osmundae IAM 14324]KEI39846.1 hypothetical protein L969DRAFT_60497 [Mixia osmundae IAM 14324]GAA99221.1 hypothetical protein E5Q_05914 [Mixia osmundae IAM 14324]